jgi:isoleucyl-tRNA synthetase
VTEAMDNYDVLGGTRPIADFVDGLSNWYVRLSRRRFWDGDAAALRTLHHVLVTVSKLLAPTTPFIAEAIFQNLVADVDAEATDSVHLSQWPQFEADLIDEPLNMNMALAQRVTSLGHSARQAANLKVRQPLAQVVVRVRSDNERESLMAVRDLVLDELNVKTLTFADEAEELVDIIVFPYPRQLGQKYGSGFPKIRQAIAEMDAVQLAASLQAGKSVIIEAQGERYEVSPEDVEIRSTPRAGFSVAEGGGYLVAVTTELDVALEREGYARELVRRIQQLRKDAGLDISDRIVTYIVDSELVHTVLNDFGDYVRDETLTEDLVQVHGDAVGSVPAHLPQTEFELAGKDVVVAVGKK